MVCYARCLHGLGKMSRQKSHKLHRAFSVTPFAAQRLIIFFFPAGLWPPYTCSHRASTSQLRLSPFGGSGAQLFALFSAPLFRAAFPRDPLHGSPQGGRGAQPVGRTIILDIPQVKNLAKARLN